MGVSFLIQAHQPSPAPRPHSSPWPLPHCPLHQRTQLDLEKEAHNLTEFSQKFALDDWVVFPRPVEGYVSRHALVETLMEGRPILNYMKLRNEVGGGWWVVRVFGLGPIAGVLAIAITYGGSLCHESRSL